MTSYSPATAQHFLFCAGVLALVVLAGSVARRFAPFDGRPVPAAPSSSTARAVSILGQPGETSLTKAAPALSSLSAEERQAAIGALDHAFEASNPVAAQATALHTLLAGARSTEDFRIIVDALNTTRFSANGLLLYTVFLNTVCEKWSALDPKAAFEGAEALTRYGRAQDAASIVGRVWANRDPLAALAHSQTLEGNHLMGDILNPALIKLAERPTDEAWSALRSVPSSWFSSSSSNILAKMWNEDPEGAWQKVLDTESSHARTMSLRTLAEIAAQHDAASVWEKGVQLLNTDPAEAGVILGRTLHHGLSKADMLRLADSPGRAERAEQLIQSALAAAKALPPGEPRQSVLGSIAWNNELVGDPVLWQLLDDLSDRADRAAVAEPLLRSRYLNPSNPDPAAATLLTSFVADPAERYDFHRLIGELWGAVDPEAASNWLGSLKPSLDRDAAVGEFVRKVLTESPEAALEWTATIGNDDLRQRRLIELFPQWVERDPDGAQSWLESNDTLGFADRNALRER